jgi:hypothetical protein
VRMVKKRAPRDPRGVISERLREVIFNVIKVKRTEDDCVQLKHVALMY